MGFREFVVRRTINSFILVIAVVIFCFFVFRLMPGDASSILIGDYFDPLRAEQLRMLWGLDQPLLVQFAQYIINMFTFNYGYSFVESRPVIETIAARLPNTLLLTGTAAVITIVLGIVAGIVAATRRGSTADKGLVTTTLAFYSTPSFWLGMIFILLFATYLPLFPKRGTVHSPAPEDPLLFALSVGHHLMLPAFTLALVSFGAYMLVTRNTLVEVMSEDYILTARAKGVNENAVLYKHAMRNAVLPLVSMIALTFGFLITGATLTETVFDWYGVGRLIFDSIQARDYPVLQAIFFILAIAVIIANFIADLLYGYLDPRVRFD
ncbi:MAG: ABC transporter permease [Candidatus Odinarchaeota archaeon]